MDNISIKVPMLNPKNERSKRNELKITNSLVNHEIDSQSCFTPNSLNSGTMNQGQKQTVSNLPKKTKKPIRRESAETVEPVKNRDFMDSAIKIIPKEKEKAIPIERYS